jgi:putative transposase
MRSRYRFVDNDGVYFLTCTVVAWIPALIQPRMAQCVVDNLRYCQKHKGMRIYAYVIMDNHLHFVAQGAGLTSVIQSFKSYTAHRLVEIAQDLGQDWLMSQFRFYKAPHKTTSSFQVWQEGSHPQVIESSRVLLQKMEYIHNNPVRRGWVAAPEHWQWSSAAWYAGDRAGALLQVDEVPG